MIRSKKYLAGSRGAPCTFRIPGICNSDWSTTVPCHIRDGNKGTGNKASDLSVANGCFACHDAMDGRSIVLSKEDWLFYALRGLQETLEQRYAAGLLIVPVDPEKPSQTISRKPKGQRKPIPKPVDTVWAKRKLQGRKFGG